MSVALLNKPISPLDEQPKDLAKNLQELKALFGKAEVAIKKAEKIGGEVVIPAICELRYAGHHFIIYSDALEQEQFEHIQRAKRHCRRAIYDAAEAIVLFYLEEIKIFQQDYRLVHISGTIPNYLELKKTFREIAQKIQTDHGERKSGTLMNFLKIQKTFKKHMKPLKMPAMS